MSFSTPGRQMPSEPAVAVSPAGLAVVAWWRRDASLAPQRDVVQMRTRANPSAAFLGPRTLSARTRNLSPQPVAAASAGRRTLVGWTDESAAVGLSLPRGASSPAVTLLHEGAGADLQDLRVAIAPTGAAVAVWVREDPVPAVRISLRSPNTGAWSTAADVGPAGAARPAVAMAADGSGLVVWERPGGIDLAAIAADGAVGAPAPVPGAGATARRPALAMNAAGDATLAWWEGGLVGAARPAGAAFGAPVAISETGGVPGPSALRAPELTLSPTGRAVAAWRRAVGGRMRVEAAVGALGAAWSTPVVVSPTSSRSAGRPSLAANARGAAVVVWSQPVGTSLSAVRARILGTATAAFGPVEALSTSAGRGTAPSAGIDAAGRAVVAWRQDPVGGAGRSFRGAIRRAIG